MTQDEFLYKSGWTITCNGVGHVYPTTYRKGDYVVYLSCDAVSIEANLGNVYTPDVVIVSQEVEKVYEDTAKTCISCGSDKASSRVVTHIKEGDREVMRTVKCGDCVNVTPSYYRDADGNRVLYPKDNSPMYSYAVDRSFSSQRDMSEWCKRNNAVQVGGGRNTNRPNSWR